MVVVKVEFLEEKALWYEEVEGKKRGRGYWYIQVVRVEIKSLDSVSCRIGYALLKESTMWIKEFAKVEKQKEKEERTSRTRLLVRTVGFC